jgi:TLD
MVENIAKYSHVFHISSARSTVFGGYCSEAPINTADYFGDDSSFIFSLLPVCRVYKHMSSSNDSDKSGRHFAYFNTDASRGPVGFGMGGRHPGKCRIWIGKDMRSSSYAVSGDDDTYLNGSLTASGDLMMGLENILLGVEIWSFGNEERRKEWHQTMRM